MALGLQPTDIQCKGCSSKKKIFNARYEHSILHAKEESERGGRREVLWAQ
jgi:hypothetical protein